MPDCPTKDRLDAMIAALMEEEEAAAAKRSGRPAPAPTVSSLVARSRLRVNLWRADREMRAVFENNHGAPPSPAQRAALAARYVDHDARNKFLELFRSCVGLGPDWDWLGRAAGHALVASEKWEN